MSGPTPKLPERRQRRNNSRVQLRGVPAVAPAPPLGLLKRTKQAWIAYWGSEMVRFVEPDTDGPAVYRLFSLYDERERAYRGYRRERLMKGSQGQLVLNPLARMLIALDGEIRALEDRLGLTPRARLQLGVQLGDAARALRDLNSELDDDVDDGAEDPRLQAI